MNLVPLLTWFWEYISLKGLIIGKDKIIHEHVIINDDVLLVENLFYNLIISQLCDNDFTVSFHKHTCIVKDIIGYTVLQKNMDGNTYKIIWNASLSDHPTCLVASQSDKHWPWHKHLNHLNFKSINKS